MRREHFDIARASIDDDQDIVPLMAAFNQAEGIEWQPPTMVPALRDLLRRPDIGLVLLARDRASGAAAGYAIATYGFDIEFAGADAVLTELFVDARFRGRGVGRGLLESVERAVRERGCHALHLMVRPENAVARSLYERAGFHTVPRLFMTKALLPGGE